MPTTTEYGLDLMVELAVGQAANAAHWGTSKWGQGLWGTQDTSLGDWVDVTCDVLDELTLSAGSNTDDGVTRRWESASAAFTLDGPTWDPWNGPYATIVGDRTPVRISWRPDGAAPWVRAFVGFVATRGYDWDPDVQEAQVACIDGTSILVASDLLPQAPVGAGETAAARVQRVATNAYWTGGFDITAGGTALQATTLDLRAWDELLQVADTDLALLWITRAGVLAYRPRGRVGVGTYLAGRLVVCEAGPNDIGVMTMGQPQPSVTRNRVTIARRADPAVTNDAPVATYIEDRQSVARYQAHDFLRTDLWNIADSWSAIVAQAVLGGGAWPSRAPGVVVLDSITDDDRVGPLLLTLEPDMTFDVVDDSGTTWREGVVGWSVVVSFESIEGQLQLEDITRWTNRALWGTGKWGVDRWGIGGI